MATGIAEVNKLARYFLALAYVECDVQSRIESCMAAVDRHIATRLKIITPEGPDASNRYPPEAAPIDIAI